MTATPVLDIGSGDSLGTHLRPWLMTFAAPPRVLVVGNYGRGNLGDEAILAGILDDLRGLAVPCVLTREPNAVAVLHDVQAVQSLSWRAVRTVLRTDVVSIGGGGIFGNGMTLLPKLLPIVAVALQLLGKKVVFAAIGAYATAPWWVSALLRRIARRSPLVTVRDPESAATFGAMARLVRDPGVDLVPAARSVADDVLRSAGADPDAALLGVSVKPAMDPAYTERQHALALAAINWWLTRTTGQAVIFVMSLRGDFGLGTSVSDRTLADRLVAECVAPQRVSIVGPALHPSVMKAVIARTEVVLAHRLHAQIFAWSSGVDLVGMSYERKSDEFLRMVGAPRIDLAEPHPGDDALWLRACELAAGTAVAGPAARPVSVAPRDRGIE